MDKVPDPVATTSKTRCSWRRTGPSVSLYFFLPLQSPPPPPLPPPSTHLLPLLGARLDYLKVDYCGSIPTTISEYEAWAQMRDALNSTGRPIYYSICPKTAAPDLGPAVPYAGQLVYSPPSNWTRDDRAALANSILVEYVNLVDTWYCPMQNCCMNSCKIGAGGRSRRRLDEVEGSVQLYLVRLCPDPLLSLARGAMWSHHQPGCGAANDPSKLQSERQLERCRHAAGMRANADAGKATGTIILPHLSSCQICNMGTHSTGMTHDGYRAAFSLWCVLGSPLILSADLRSSASADVRSCLQDIALNGEAIAVNQDPAALPAFLVSQTVATNVSVVTNSTQITTNILARPLHDGAMAVVLLNRQPFVQIMAITWQQLGWPSTTLAQVRDLWLRQTIGNFTSGYGADVPAQGAVFLRITPVS